MITSELKELILRLSKEFDEKDGFVTCEVGIHETIIDSVEAFVLENVTVNKGKWVFSRCEACVANNGEGYVHFSLEKFDVVEKIEASDNHILTV